MKRLALFITVLFAGLWYHDAALADRIWHTTWTNPDGSSASTSATFHAASRDNVVGTYEWNNGRFVGELLNNGKSFDGYWVQDASEQACDRAVDGSYYWGRAWFKVSADNSFTGRWGYCERSPQYDWRGSSR